MGTTPSRLLALSDDLHNRRKHGVNQGVDDLVTELNSLLPDNVMITLKQDTIYRDIVYYLKVFRQSSEISNLLSLMRKVLSCKIIYDV